MYRLSVQIGLEIGEDADFIYRSEVRRKWLVQLVDTTSHASRDFGHIWVLEKGFPTIWGKTKWVSPSHMVIKINKSVCV
jgi:hypothetical protein